MVQGRAAASGAGKDADCSAFGSAGRGAMDVGNLQEIIDEEMEREAEEQEADDGDAEPGKKDPEASPKQTDTLSKKEAWFNADEKTSSATRTHNRWAEDTLQSCLKNIGGYGCMPG